MWKRDKQRVYLSQGISHNKALFATNRRPRKTSAPMPTLFRFLTIIALIVGAVAGSLYVLAEYFQPVPKEISKSLRGVKARDEVPPPPQPATPTPPAEPAPEASDPAQPSTPGASTQPQ